MEVRGALPPQQPLLKENRTSEVSTCPQHRAGLGFKCWGEGGGRWYAQWLSAALRGQGPTWAQSPGLGAPRG